MDKYLVELEKRKLQLAVILKNAGVDAGAETGAALVVLGTEMFVLQGLHAKVPPDVVGEVLRVLRAQGWMNGFIMLSLLAAMSGENRAFNPDLLKTGDQVMQKFERAAMSVN